MAEKAQIALKRFGTNTDTKGYLERAHQGKRRAIKSFHCPRAYIYCREQNVAESMLKVFLVWYQTKKRNVLLETGGKVTLVIKHRGPD